MKPFKQHSPKLMNNPFATHIDFFQFKGLIEDNPKACPCNIDMIFERKARFLVGEWKRAGESISLGQEIMLKALSTNPSFKVLIIHGNTDDETEVKKFELIKNGKYITLGHSFEQLKYYVTLWYRWANGEK